MYQSFLDPVYKRVGIRNKTLLEMKPGILHCQTQRVLHISNDLTVCTLQSDTSKMVQGSKWATNTRSKIHDTWSILPPHK